MYTPPHPAALGPTLNPEQVTVSTEQKETNETFKPCSPEWLDNGFKPNSDLHSPHSCFRLQVNIYCKSSFQICSTGLYTAVNSLQNKLKHRCGSNIFRLNIQVSFFIPFYIILFVKSVSIVFVFIDLHTQCQKSVYF